MTSRIEGMSDTRLRELERQYRALSTVENEAAYLLECVRNGKQLDPKRYQRLAELNDAAAARYLQGRLAGGDLQPEELELAAYCAHQPARLALPEETPPVPGDLETWLRRLDSASRPLRLAVLRASVAPLGEEPAKLLEDAATSTAPPARVDALAALLLRRLTRHRLEELHTLIREAGPLLAVALVCARADAGLPMGPAMDALGRMPVWPESSPEGKGKVLARIQSAVLEELLRERASPLAERGAARLKQ